MDEFDFEEEGKSKTQLKKEMLALQKIGTELTKLPPDKLARIPLDEKLHHAVLETANIKKHGALRRHMQFIGRLMRESDSEAIIAAYETLQQSESNAARKIQQVEDWRDALIEEGKPKIEDLLQLYPHADRQQLNQLVRNCQKDIDQQSGQQKNSGSKRKLFLFLRDLIIEV